jgi:NAD(P)-dependent dehydrogenase (short-subunit alcohol dehydrogenase family)
MKEFGVSDLAIDVKALFSVAGKKVLITGGSRGLGFFMACALVQEGAHVVIVGRKQEPLREAVARLGEVGACSGVAADIGREDGVATVVDKLTSDGEPIHALVNNAGTTWAARLAEYPAQAFDRALGVNLKGPFLLVQGLLPLLRGAGTQTDPARIINVGSTDGRLPPRYETYAYSSTKAGLHMLTRHLAYHLRDQNVCVNTIAPGLFRTSMTEYRFATPEDAAEVEAEIPLGRSGRPADIAGAIVYLCSPASAYITGAVLAVDGGYASLR